MSQNKGFKIRDLRNGDWYWIHKIIYRKYSSKIGAIGLALYNAYAFYANKGECFPSQKTIAKKLNVSERTIQKFNRILEDTGLIKIESGKKRGKSNEIYLLKVGCEKDSYPSESPSHPPAKEIRTNNNNINNNKLTKGFSKKTPYSRKKKKFPLDWYDYCIKRYEKLKGIKLYGDEYKPIQQELKTMFMSNRKPEQIIAFMEWLNSSDEEWTRNWTIKTVRMKIPEFAAGNFQQQMPIPGYAKEVILKQPTRVSKGFLKKWREETRKIFKK